MTDLWSLEKVSHNRRLDAIVSFSRLPPSVIARVVDKLAMQQEPQ
jgi:hypothetical protein